MTTFSETTEDVARAVAIIAGRQVVRCPQPADAASPVYLHRGKYVRQIGQSADWRHRTEEAARAHGAVLVEGYYRGGDRWETEVDGLDERQERDVRDLLRRERAAAAGERTRQARAAEAAEAAGQLARMRRAIGLPDGVLPDLKLVRVNGAIGVWLPGDAGPPYFGPFSVGPAGELVVPG